MKLISNPKFSKVWRISIAALLWSIWLSHNNLIFNKVKSSKSSILHLVKMRARSWACNAQLLSGGEVNLWCCDPNAAILHMTSQNWHSLLDETLFSYEFIV